MNLSTLKQDRIANQNTSSWVTKSTLDKSSRWYYALKSCSVCTENGLDEFPHVSKFISRRLPGQEMQITATLRGLQPLPHLHLICPLQKSCTNSGGRIAYLNNMIVCVDIFLKSPFLFYQELLWIPCNTICGILLKQKRALAGKLLLPRMRNSIWNLVVLVLWLIKDLGGIL